MNLYSRQSNLDLKYMDTATIIGCGGTGFWTALFLAMSGIKHLVLIDPDIVEESNLNRLPLAPSYIRYEKVAALKDTILKLRPLCIVERHTMKILNEQDCSIIRGTIFCCTDNLQSQRLICAYARKNSLPYQRVGYDGIALNVSNAFPLSFDEEIQTNGYEVVPSWVVPAVLSASAGVFSQMYSPLVLMDNMDTLVNRELSHIPKGIKDKLIDVARSDLLDDGYNNCNNCDRVYPDDLCQDCSRVREDEYNNLKNDYDELENNYDRLEKEYKDLENSFDDLQDEYNNLQDEYNNLKKEGENE